MDHVARLVHAIARKFLKKRRQSIEGKREYGGLKEPTLMKLSMDDTAVDENDLPPPLTPARSRSIEFLRASTPVRAPGIMVHEGGAEIHNEDDVSQAESCLDWNESIREIHVDSPEEFVLSGGDDSSSVICLEEESKEISQNDQTEEKGNVHEDSVSYEFIYDEEYEEDGFDAIVEQQSAFPVERPFRKGYFFHPTIWEEDEEGFEWEESKGFSDPALVPSVPADLAVPSLCNYKERELCSLAQSLINEDSCSSMGRTTTREESIPPANCTYVVRGADISPTTRPDTPTTVEQPMCSPVDLSNKCVSPPLATTFVLSSPPLAREEDNEWLRSNYERAGLTNEIPEWMHVDPPKKESSEIENSMVEEERKARGLGGFLTSTPVTSMFSPAFSSISTIPPHLNDSSRTINSPGLNFTLEMAVRSRVILAKPAQDLYKLTADVELDED